MQGHLRLVLLPIVYNAMALEEELRQLPLCRALQRAMRASAYDRLLRHPPPGPDTPEKILRLAGLLSLLQVFNVYSFYKRIRVATDIY